MATGRFENTMVPQLRRMAAFALASSVFIALPIMAEQVKGPLKTTRVENAALHQTVAPSTKPSLPKKIEQRHLHSKDVTLLAMQ